MRPCDEMAQIDNKSVLLMGPDSFLYLFINKNWAEWIIIVLYGVEGSGNSVMEINGNKSPFALLSEVMNIHVGTSLQVA